MCKRDSFDVNLRGTFNVMEACVKKGVKRLVYSSSASVYGDAVREPMDEDHPFNNKNFYGATKIAGEAMLRAFHHRYGLNYGGRRYMNVYGPVSYTHRKSVCTARRSATSTRASASVVAWIRFSVPLCWPNSAASTGKSNSASASVTAIPGSSASGNCPSSSQRFVRNARVFLRNTHSSWPTVIAPDKR